MSAQYTIHKGTHAAKPCFLRIKRKPHAVRWRASFVQPEYALGDADQLDWNKLFGLSFHLFTNHENSWMMGWRWNEQERVIELNEYMHRNGKTEYSTVIATCSAGQTIDCQMLIDYKRDKIWCTIHIDGQEVYSMVRQYTRLRKWTREINTWFGGNRKAPNDILLWKGTHYG